MMFINEITLSEEKQIEIMAGIISVIFVQHIKLRIIQALKPIDIYTHSILLGLVWACHFTIRKVLMKIYKKMRENKMLQN